MYNYVHMESLFGCGERVTCFFVFLFFCFNYIFKGICETNSFQTTTLGSKLSVFANVGGKGKKNMSVMHTVPIHEF